jgi:hypothetical protein
VPEPLIGQVSCSCGHSASSGRRLLRGVEDLFANFYTYSLEMAFKDC